MKQLVKRVTIATAILIGWNLTEERCLAAGNSQDSLSIKEIQYSSDGGKATLQSNEDGSYELTFSTKGKEIGYYTVSIFSEQDISVEKKEVIAFQIKTKDSITMNLNMMTKELQAVHSKDGSSVYLKSEKEKTYEMVSVENGVFEIPKGFAGMVYVPLDSFGNEKFQQRIQRFGLIITQQEEKNSEITLGNIEVLSAKKLPTKALQYCYQLMGNKTPLIPAVGDHEYGYTITRFEHENEHIPYTIALSHEEPGVLVSKNGTVTFSEGAKPEEITLFMTIDQSFHCLYRIQPEYSWFMKQEDNRYKDYMIPAKDEVVKYSSMEEFSYDYVGRFLLVAASFLYLLFYVRKIRKA